MKANWKIIEKLIIEMGQVKFNYFYSSAIDPSWSLLYGDSTTEYQVYISYVNPKDVKMYFIAPPPFIFNLSPAEKKSMESNHKYMFCFLTVTQMIEDQFGVLSKQTRKKVTSKIEETIK